MTPVKEMTIPHIELCATHLLVATLRHMQKALHLDIQSKSSVSPKPICGYFPSRRVSPKCRNIQRKTTSKDYTKGTFTN